MRVYFIVKRTPQNLQSSISPLDFPTATDFCLQRGHRSINRTTIFSEGAAKVISTLC